MHFLNLINMSLFSNFNFMEWVAKVGSVPACTLSSNPSKIINVRHKQKKCIEDDFM